MLKELIDHLKDIVICQFRVLSEEYVADMMNDLASEIESVIKEEYAVRYLLIDGETGQLESRRLFEKYQEALDEMKHHNLTHCQIGTVLMEA